MFEIPVFIFTHTVYNHKLITMLQLQCSFLLAVKYFVFNIATFFLLSPFCGITRYEINLTATVTFGAVKMTTLLTKQVSLVSCYFFSFRPWYSP